MHTDAHNDGVMNRLQRVSRRVMQLVLAMLVLVSFYYCESRHGVASTYVGIHERPFRLGLQMVGWPFLHYNSFSEALYGSTSPIYESTGLGRASIFLNGLLALFTAGCTSYIAGRIFGARDRFLSYRLGTQLAAFTTLAITLGIWQLRPTLTPGPSNFLQISPQAYESELSAKNFKIRQTGLVFEPTAFGAPWFVRLTLLVGLACTIFTTILILGSLAKTLATLTQPSSTTRPG